MNYVCIVRIRHPMGQKINQGTAYMCKFQEFHKRGYNLKKIPILRPNLGVKTQFLVKNCMILK